MTHDTFYNLNPTIPIDQQDHVNIIQVLEVLIEELDHIRRTNLNDGIEDRIERLEAVALLAATAALANFNKET